MGKKIVLIFLLIIYTTLSFGEGKKYNRIVSVNLSGDEMLVGLVDENRIVGLSGAINEEEDMSNICEVAKKFPKVEKNLELILELEPDLVIGGDWLEKSFIQSIEDTGVEVFIYKTPTNFKEQIELIRNLSKKLEEEKRGEEIIKDMEERLAKLQARIKAKNPTHKPRIMMYTSIETTVTENTTFDDMVKLIGGINVAVGQGIDASQKISKEKVIEIDPEIIIVPVWENHINNEDFIKFLTEDESFQSLTALQEKKIYMLPYKKLSPTSQYMIDGIEELGEVVYNLEESI